MTDIVDLSFTYSFTVYVEAVSGYSSTDGGGILLMWQTEHANGRSELAIPDAEKRAMFCHKMGFSTIVEGETLFQLGVYDYNKRTQVGFLDVDLEAHLPKAIGATSRLRATIPLLGEGAEGVTVDIAIGCRKTVEALSQEEEEQAWEQEEEEAMVDPVAMRRLVQTMYEYYAPEKCGQVDTLMAKYAGNEQTLLDGLISKYGPIPTPCEIAMRKSVMAKKSPEEPSLESAFHRFLVLLPQFAQASKTARMTPFDAHHRIANIPSRAHPTRRTTTKAESMVVE